MARANEKFLVGQKWKTRGGQIKEIKEVQRASDVYPMSTKDGSTYNKDGGYWGSGGQHQNDLVELVTTPHSTTKSATVSELAVAVAKVISTRKVLAEAEADVQRLKAALQDSEVLQEFMALFAEPKEDKPVETAHTVSYGTKLRVVKTSDVHGGSCLQVGQIVTKHKPFGLYVDICQKMKRILVQLENGDCQNLQPECFEVV